MNIKCPAYPESSKLEFSKWQKILKDISIEENKWFMDIGASFGIVSFSFLSKKPSKIICFEPNSVRFNLLKDNVDNNNLSDTFEIFNKACSDKYESVEMISAFTNDNGGFVKTDYIDRSKSEGIRENISCVNIYNFLISTYKEQDLIDNLKFIKIDTEGHDYIILNNLRPLILKIKPIIVIEWWHEPNINQNIFDAIKSIGYKPYNCDTMKAVGPEDFYKKSENLILLPI